MHDLPIFIVLPSRALVRKHPGLWRSKHFTTAPPPCGKNPRTTQTGSEERCWRIFDAFKATLEDYVLTRSALHSEPLGCTDRAAVAQLVARRSHNPKVVSSILTCRIFANQSSKKMARVNHSCIAQMPPAIGIDVQAFCTTDWPPHVKYMKYELCNRRLLNLNDESACSVAVSYKPPMLVTRVRLPACAFFSAWRAGCNLQFVK